MKKLMKMHKKNNKGFSLVELIVVIAIMAVLIGVLAPQFIKYVDRSKKSTDIKNGQELASAIMADITDGTIAADSAGVEITSANLPAAMGTLPTPKTEDTLKWVAVYTVANGTVEVYLVDAVANIAADNMVYPTAGADFVD